MLVFRLKGNNCCQPTKNRSDLSHYGERNNSSMREIIITLGFCLLAMASARADDAAKDPFYDLADEPRGLPYLRLKTSGGKQFWSDEHVFHQWRIQRHAQTGHCRLLDDKNVRRASGNYPHCRQVLENLKSEEELPPMRGKAVVVLHGLTRSRNSMNQLCDYLEKHGGYITLNISYASSRKGISRHAESLARLLSNLDGIEEINFVAHSLGNLVIRHYLGDHSGPDNPPDDRIQRIVMLGPPNQGSTIARRMKDNTLFRTVWGSSGSDLAESWDDLQPLLATPKCEFGIVAGGKGDGKGMNPLIDGDDDFVVAVKETRLAGARDFVVRPVIHTHLMMDETIFRYTLRFLQHGHFMSDTRRQPIDDE